MSERSREDEKLSFKEQILRDLEKIKERDEGGVSGPATQGSEPAPEDLIADSLSVVDEILKNAPSVTPEAPVEEKVEPEAPTPTPVENDFPSTPAKVKVSYFTYHPAPESVAKEEVALATPSQEEGAEMPRRSRRDSAKPAKKKKKSHWKGLLVFFLILLALLGGGGFFGYQYVQSALLPIDANSKEYVTVQIPDGANVQQIGDVLEKSGLVKHGLLFGLYTRLKNEDNLKSGYYNLQKSMSTDDIIKELQKGGTPEPQEPVLATLTIPEGYTIEQIAQTVGQANLKEGMTADAFLAKVKDEAFITQAISKYPSLLESLPAADSGARYRLEGYLFPATYSIKESTTMETLVDDMLAAMDKILTPYYATIKDKNLTVNELLSVASLVEKEGAKTADRKLIAGVFYNRINQGMPLQSNIAILYAEGKLGQNITLADDAGIDTQIDSPYNVYTNLGLMPGPVDSPSLDAIESSINQTKSDNLYFVADVTDGTVYFATNRAEHDQNVAEHVNSKLTQSSSSN